MRVPAIALEAASAISGISRELMVSAKDGVELAATLFEPGMAAGGETSLVVIGGATAVKRSYYARVAGYLAELGHPLLTFDYRGIGGSPPGSPPCSHRGPGAP